MDIKSTWPALLAAGLLTLTPAVAQDQLKVGVANLAKLRQGAPQMQEAGVALEREFAERQRTLVAEQREVQQMQERLTREADVITDPDEAARLERELRMRQRDLQRDGQQYEEDLNMRRNEELGRVTRLILSEVQAFSQEEQYDVVLVEGVIYASDRVDITDAVLERLKARAGN